MVNKTITRIVSILFFSMVNLPSSNDALAQDSGLDNFYRVLHEEINSEWISPLRIANHEALVVSDFEMMVDNNIIRIVEESAEKEIQLDHVEINYKAKDTRHTFGFGMKFYMKGGEIQEIYELKMPERVGNMILVQTNLQGVVMQVTPLNGCFRWEVKHEFHSDIDSIVIVFNASGPFYGGGERFMSSKLNGRTISNQPHDHSLMLHRLKNDDVDLKEYEPTYMQIPFVLNPHGQGWYFDGGATMFLTFDENGESFQSTIRGNKAVFYSFSEISPKQMLEKYTYLLGRQPALPDWAHGVWVNLLEGQDSVLAKATRLREEDMPVTAVWLFDMDDPVTSTGWPYWSRGIYMDYRKLTDSIHGLGYKALTYLRPFGYKDLLYYKFDNPFYSMYDSLGVVLHAREELPGPRYSTFMAEGQYDFYNPMMGRLWDNVLSELLLKDNFDGWMEDFGDIGYAYDNKLNQWQPLDFGLNYSMPNAEYVNAYPLVYHKLTHLLSSNIKPGIATFSRSGSAGSAPYTRLIWAGDQHANWDKELGYPSAITSGITCGLSGYSNWTCDILCDSESRELWKRWVQFAAFSPLMRDHLWTNNANAIDIWIDKEAFDFFKKYARIHMELVPYIQETAKEYRETGTPIMRHMMLEFPEENETYDCEYQYMFGSKFLIAPVVEEGETSKKVYFPKGVWKGFWNGDVIKSKGEWINVPAPIDLIPVFVRE